MKAQSDEAHQFSNKKYQEIPNSDFYQPVIFFPLQGKKLRKHFTSAESHIVTWWELSKKSGEPPQSKTTFGKYTVCPRKKVILRKVGNMRNRCNLS